MRFTSRELLAWMALITLFVASSGILFRDGIRRGWSTHHAFFEAIGIPVVAAFVSILGSELVFGVKPWTFARLFIAVVMAMAAAIAIRFAEWFVVNY